MPAARRTPFRTGNVSGRSKKKEKAAMQFRFAAAAPENRSGLPPPAVFRRMKKRTIHLLQNRPFLFVANSWLLLALHLFDLSCIIATLFVKTAASRFRRCFRNVLSGIAVLGSEATQQVGFEARKLRK
jgi:hypothetical protein